MTILEAFRLTLVVPENETPLQKADRYFKWASLVMKVSLQNGGLGHWDGGASFPGGLTEHDDNVIEAVGKQRQAAQAYAEACENLEAARKKLKAADAKVARLVKP